MKKRLLFLLTFTALLVGACVYDFDAGLSGEEGILVVEGDILIGDYTNVRLSRSMGLTGSDELVYVSGRCYVESSDGKRYGNGSPRIDTRSADPSREYRLVVETGGRNYTSEWAPVLQTPPIDSVSYSISDDRSTMTIDVSTHGDEANRYYRWVAEQTWEYHAPFQASHYFVQSGSILDGERVTRDTVVMYKNGANSYYCWNSGVVHDVMVASTDQLAENRLIRHPLYKIDCYEQRISYLYAVDLRQEAISELAYRYWTMLQKNTTDVGGLFSPEPYEMRGNVTCTEDPSEMVLGYVSVTAPATTRYFIRSHAIQFHKTRRSDFDFEPVYVQRSDWRLYYRRNYDVYMLHTEEGAGTGRDTEEDYEFDWLPARCIKCWLWGTGTKQKPEWWPNDHQ